MTNQTRLSIFKNLAAASCCLLLVACASTPRQTTDSLAETSTGQRPGGMPDWALTPPSAAGMAYGVGSIEVYGDPVSAIKRASELARVDLVSQLRVTISGDFSSTVTETSGSDKETRVQRNVSQYARSQVAEVQLDEVTITDASVAGGYAYALAELDRTAAAARLRQQMSEIEQQLDQYTDVAPQGDTLQQLRVMLPVLELIAERQAFADKLGLVSVQHQIPALSAEHQALQQRVYSLLDQLTVRISFDNDDARLMQGELIETLASQGLRVQTQGNTDLVFAVSAERSSRQQGGRFYAFVQARITIADSQSRVLSSFSDTARGVSGLETKAWQGAASAVADQLQQELAKTLAERLR
ncbi:hypothetical protein [Oceanobacter sp. 4_MG-2023]|uniref:hypothetical protein n=1 Tax=Oceanobacter sp. 4_MG-2023 TaxID=3062623 RepID=UPI0027371039|nr:hypothetical protein [Oceanobacter sp. 4_MG-2023]MDP2546883.1 hypothetical protein [Oceanobacter sp. 4_MG-2023]